VAVLYDELRKAILPGVFCLIPVPAVPQRPTCLFLIYSDSQAQTSLRGSCTCRGGHAPSRSPKLPNGGHDTVCQASWRDPTGGSPVRVRHSEPPGSECCRRRGNAGSEAYTVIVWGVGLSHEMTTSRRPRPSCAPKAICVVPPSRGAIAPPGSKATSRTKGSRRNLGGPAASADRSFGGGDQRGKTEAGCTAAGSRTTP